MAKTTKEAPVASSRQEQRMEAFRWQVGAASITRVPEIEIAVPPAAILPDAKPETLAPHASWLKPHFVTSEEQFTFSLHGFVVESEGKVIVVDTCVGEQENLAPFGGSRFLERLAGIGVAREDVDFVLCTHLHFDHVGWNTMKDGDRWVPTFPNARYLFSKLEYEHWRGETEAGRGTEHAFLFDDAVRPIVEMGLADLVELDHRVTGEVCLVPTPGHSPGHVAVLVSSSSQEALITGDSSHHPVQWAELDWPMPADSDSPQAADTRRVLLKRFGGSPTLIIGSHYASPCAGYLVASGGGFVFRACGTGSSP